jgi:hypothetical protein
MPSTAAHPPLAAKVGCCSLQVEAVGARIGGVKRRMLVVTIISIDTRRGQPNRWKAGRGRRAGTQEQKDRNPPWMKEEGEKTPMDNEMHPTDGQHEGVQYEIQGICSHRVATLRLILRVRNATLRVAGLGLRGT